MSAPFDPTLYVVTDHALARGRSPQEVVRRALAGGATMIQYREKTAPFRAMAGQADALLHLCRAAGAAFIVNDFLDVALEVGADGVHLGQDDLDPARARRLGGERLIIGVSVRTPEQARAARDAGADYLGANGVYPTATKSGLGEPLGAAGLAALGAVGLPVVAIGGIDEARAEEAVRAGAAGVAVVSAVVGAEDIEGACRALLAAIARGRKR